MFETLDYTIRIGSTPTILYFDFYLYSAYAAHVYFYISYCSSVSRAWSGDIEVAGSMHIRHPEQ